MRLWRPWLAAFLLLLVATWAPSALAATECQVQLEALEVDRIDVAGRVTLTCTGDPVTFIVGSDIVNNVIDSGTALLVANGDPNVYGNIELVDAQDVTFTSVVLRLYQYIPSDWPLTLRRCSRCSIQQLLVEDVELDTVGGSLLLVVDSSVTIDGANVTNVNLNSLYESASFLTATNSDVILNGATLTGAVLGTTPSVSISGGTFAAAGVSWQGVSQKAGAAFTDHGYILTADSGARVTMGGCTVEDVVVVPRADGDTDALLHLKSNSSIVVDADCSLSLPDGSTGVVVRADDANSVVLGGASVRQAGPDWIQPTVAVRSSDPLLPSAWLELSSIMLAGGPVYTNNLRLSNVSFTGAAPVSDALLTVQDGAAVLTGCTFAGVTSQAFDSAVILNVVNSSADVTGCTFADVSWDTAFESQAVHANTGSVLRITDSRFLRVGGCGTAIRASGSRLEMMRVNITDTDVSAPTGEKRSAVVVEGGSIAADGCYWQRIDVGASTNGAALTVSNSISTRLAGCMFSDIRSPRSPAVQFVAPSAASTDNSLVGCSWTNVTSMAALAYKQLSIGASLSSVAFEACATLGTGASGTITLDCTAGGTGNLLVSDSTFRGNAAATGGAVHAVGCRTRVRNSTFTSNKATYGGALSAVGGGSETAVENSTFIDNSASNSGGAVFMERSATLSLSYCSFIANTANVTGGAVAALGLQSTGSGVGSILIQGSSLLRNTVGCTFDCYGGALAAESVVLVINGSSSFERNLVKAPRGGAGALYVSKSKVQIDDARFFANAADYVGGACLFNSTSLVLRRSVLDGNTASTGAGIYITEAGDGGQPPQVVVQPLGVPQYDSYIESTAFSRNNCPTDAAASASGGALIATRQRGRQWNLRINGSSFTNNYCSQGGAIASSMLNSTFITGSNFTLNHASISGGAISLQPALPGTASHAHIQQSVFLRNTAKVLGGAVQANDGWMMFVEKNTFTQNGNIDTSLDGGAINVLFCRNLPQVPVALANIAMQRNTFTGNTALTGPAFYSESCNVTIWRDRYINNTARGGGGAIYAANTRQDPITALQMLEVYAEGNSARQSGGAVTVQAQGLLVDGSTFVRNTAKVAGGALMVTEASPVALRILERPQDPYYSLDEQYFMRLQIRNTNFSSNYAESGGGALYVDSSEMIIQGSTFSDNSAGDDLPNDEWSDSGGAIFTATCFSLSEVLRSNFTRNNATGPGGAILQLACALSLDECVFAANNGSKGGAIAAGNRRTLTSDYSNTPNLVVTNCTFTDNNASISDGGAVLSRDMNATFFTSVFQRNYAGGFGGALALLNNLDSGVRASTFEDNTAVRFGGAVYMLTTPIVYVLDSKFRRNAAGRTGGAVSIVQCDCVMTARTLYDGNSADSRGGALHLQPKGMGVGGGEANSLAAGGNCVGHFLRYVKLHMSPEGRALLGTQDAYAESYNASLLYNGKAAGFLSAEFFARGGVQLPVPDSLGPAQLLNYDATLIPGASSQLQLAAGSALPYADWTRCSLRADASGTLLFCAGSSANLSIASGVALSLARGSTVTALRGAMLLVPANTAGVVEYGALKLDGGLPVGLNASTLAVTIVPAALSSVHFANGSALTITDWNRFVLWSARVGTMLYDTVYGNTYALADMTSVVLGNGSPATQHPLASTRLAPDGNTNLTVLQGGGWGLSNGTTLTTEGSRFALSVLPANSSTARMAPGSTLDVPSWDLNTVRVDASGTYLTYTGSGARATVGPGTVLALPGGSALIALRSSMEMLEAGLTFSVLGSAWTLSNLTTVLPANSVVAVTLVPSATSRVSLPNGTSVAINDWNRYVIWSGVLGSLLFDAQAGTTTILENGAVVSLTKSSALIHHDGNAALLTASITATVRGGVWELSNGTRLGFGGGRVALTAVPGVGSTLTLPDRSVPFQQWNRFAVWASTAGSVLYDFVLDATISLPDGSVLALAKNSVLIVHDSGTSVLPSESSITVRDGAWSLSGPGSTATLSPSSAAPNLVLLPGAHSSITFGSGLQLVMATDNRYTVWKGRRGTVVYDQGLDASYRLAVGSVVSLGGGSDVVAHDSVTEVLGEHTRVTVQGSGWTLSNATVLALGVGVTQLSSVPAPGSSILFGEPLAFPAARANRYALWAGSSGTMLYDAAMKASYTLAEGSSVQLAGDTTLGMRGRDPATVTATSWTLQGGTWQLGDGTTILPGNGTATYGESQFQVHLPSITELPGEIGRTCAVDFTSSLYLTNPEAYNYAAVEDLLQRVKVSEYGTTNLAPQVSRAAYGYDAGTTDGFNATLLVPLVQYGNWEDRGRPSNAAVTCTATVAPRNAFARKLSMLHMDITAVNNQARLKGGAIVMDGGEGRVMIDSVQVFNNSVSGGDGGGLALYQDDDQLFMQLEVYIISSNISFNSAANGTGGGMSLAADNLHQQVAFFNTTINSNLAAIGGGVALYKNVSVALNSSEVAHNVGSSSSLGQGFGANIADERNLGNGGGIMASYCNELQVTAGTRLFNNTASGRGGGVSARSCALVLLNSSAIVDNRAQSAGGAYFWNDLPLEGTYTAEDPKGASIAIVAKCNLTGNTALTTTKSAATSLGSAFNASSNGTVPTEGFGGGVYVSGPVSTLLGDSYFQGNTAEMQGGSIIIQSVCNLRPASRFLSNYMPATTAFVSTRTLFNNTVRSLQWPRPKGCWGTVVYRPSFRENEAALSGGALFASHPEALSLVCDDGSNSTDNALNTPIDYSKFDEPYLANLVSEAMKKASFQVLDNRIVQRCYRSELQRLFNRSLDSLDLTGSELSTLNIGDNRAKGYGYLIAIVPSKLRIISVDWTGITSNVADGNDTTVQEEALLGPDASELGPATDVADRTLADNPFFNSAVGFQFDNDTQDFRQTVNYHVTTFSNKPMDMPIQLLDALDQVAAENTTLRQAQVRARYYGSSNGCKAELLGGIEGVARNGTAVMQAIRLRALKGENYTLEFRVEDAVFAGTVEPLVVNVSVPACSIGEVPRDNGYLCQKCDPRSFSLWQDTEPLVNCTYLDLADTTCLPCPDGAECPGGAVIVPRSGMWQSAANSTFMNECPNAEACRDGDSDAQDMLVACQQWWYSRPNDFDYQAYVDSILASESGLLTDLSAAWVNSSDPSVCALWGLPYDHPASYSKRQCAEGYAGNLCGVCRAVNGSLWAGKADFSCGQCFDRKLSMLVGIGGFVGNVFTVMLTIVLTFLADYTEDEEMAVGDLVKVVIVHIQYFVIITRLNIDWPTSISGFTSALSALTGAVNQMYSPSCLLGVDASPALMARADQLAALITPLAVVVLVAVMWLLRYFTFSFRSTGASTSRKQNRDVRTIEEYKNDRAMRAAAKRGAQSEDDMTVHTNPYASDRALPGLEEEQGLEEEADGLAEKRGEEEEAAFDVEDPMLVNAITGWTHTNSGKPIRHKDEEGQERSLKHIAVGFGDESPAQQGEDEGGTSSGARRHAAAAAASLGREPEDFGDAPPPPPAAPPPPPPAPPPPEEGAPAAKAAVSRDRPSGRSIISGAAAEADAAAAASSTSTSAGAGGASSASASSAASAASLAAGGPRSAAAVGSPTSAAASGPAATPTLPPIHPRAPSPSAPLGASPEPRTSAASSLRSSFRSNRVSFTRDPPGAPPGTPPHPCPAEPAPELYPEPGAASAAFPQPYERHAYPEPGAASNTSPDPERGTDPAPGAATAATAAANADGAAAAAALQGVGSSASSHSLTSPNPAGIARSVSSNMSARQLPLPPALAVQSSARHDGAAGAAGPAAAAAVAHVAPISTLGRAPSGRGGTPNAIGTTPRSATLTPNAVARSGSGLLKGGAAPSSVGRAASSRAAAAAAAFGGPPRSVSRGPSGRAQDVEQGGGGGGDKVEIGRNASKRTSAGGLPVSASLGRTASRARSGTGTDVPPSEGRSSAARRVMMLGKTWVTEFFKYDEEREEEGEIRWASLANIDRTMIWWRQTMLVVMIACFILYPAWAQATLQIFACYYLDDGAGPYPHFQLAQWGKGYWLLNMNQECYAGEHARLWVPIGVCCIGLVCIGIPLMTFLVTWIHRKSLSTVHVVQTYGFLYRRYNYDTYFWWESMLQVQTLLLVVVDVFGRVLVVYQQAVLLMLVLMLIMWSNMYYQPLKHELLDRMSSLSLAVLSFTVALGLFFVPPADRKDPVTPAVASAIGGIILALNVGLILYFAHVMFTHGREAITRSVEKARERMLAASSKMKSGVAAARERVSAGAQRVRTSAQRVRTATTRSITTLQDKTSRSLTTLQDKTNRSLTTLQDKVKARRTPNGRQSLDELSP